MCKVLNALHVTTQSLRFYLFCPKLLRISSKRSLQTTHLCHEFQSTAVLPNFTNLTDSANTTFVLRLVFAAIKSTNLNSTTRINRCVGCRANVELGKLIKLNLNRICGVTFTLGLDLACLFDILA